MKRGQQIVNLLPFFVEFLTPETKAKGNLALRLACLARYHSNINSAKIIRQSSYCSPVVDEALEDLTSSDGTKVSCSYVSRY